MEVIAGMKITGTILGLMAGLGLVLAGSQEAFAPEPGDLVWRAEGNRLEARIEAWPLEKVLEQISAATGWQIFVEPQTELTVSAKFQNLEVGQALARLLGNLNYALLPQTSAPAKLFVFRTSMQQATKLVRPPEIKTPKTRAKSLIPNELIVTLKPGAKTSIDDLARKLGAKVVGRAGGLNAYRLQFENEAAANLARNLLQSDLDVGSVEANYTMNPPSRMEALKSGSSPPLNLKPNQTPDPHRIIVGLIDTAVQSQPAKIADFLLPEIDVAGQAQPGSSSPTHGTSMAETILRAMAVTPSTDGTSTRILPVNVYGNNESTTTFDVANGIYTAVKNGATLINLSLGSDGESPFLHSLIQNASQQGVLFVAAAGNSPTTSPVYPAAYPEVLAATAGDRNGNIAPYANRGSFVSVVAPGGSIITFNDQAYLVTGTSSAAAYVSGLAAGLAADTGKSFTDVAAQIRRQMGVKSPAKP